MGLGNKERGPIRDTCFVISQLLDNVHSFNFSGVASFQLEYNDPPYCGKCKMLPENGTALETDFEIKCEDEPNDEDQPLYFEIASRFFTWMNYTVFHRGTFLYTV